MEFVFLDRCGIKEDEVLDTSDMDEKSKFSMQILFSRVESNPR